MGSNGKRNRDNALNNISQSNALSRLRSRWGSLQILLNLYSFVKISHKHVIFYKQVILNVLFTNTVPEIVHVNREISK